MPLLIDGHNVIGQAHDLQLSDPHDEAKLIAKLKRYAEKVQKRVVVIFDPSPHDTSAQLWDAQQDHGRVVARWAPAGRKADDVIRALVPETKDRRGLLVVTSDGAVASFVRQCGVRVQPAAEFYKELSAALGDAPAPASKPSVSTRTEIDEWLTVFKEPEAPKGAKRNIEPLPFKDPVSEVEKKRLRRNEQLRKQTRGGGKLV
jgi:uncharacterized protein